MQCPVSVTTGALAVSQVASMQAFHTLGVLTESVHFAYL
ncbi:hypothetical protein D805_0281 [Bifidobacterium thermophilum RBL67]|uniref:Uncharacterized protein n=1 Tax=Bifidobacterium thermophilum RBL67 TaxID=1254439 RepID=M4RDC9_9BIFI|nr:hypothetical protein D805_0281 [Bifidobacterium thermophilum RBL67]